MRSVLTRSGVPLALVATAAFVASLLPTAPAGEPAAPAAAAASAEECPRGFTPYEEFQAQERQMRLAQQDAASDLRAKAYAYLEAYNAETGQELGPSGLCINDKHPEELGELALRAADRAMPRMAPAGQWEPGAFAAALEQRQEMEALAVPASAAGNATPYGKGPLIVDDPRYGVSDLGLADNMGRVDDFAYDNRTGRLFAAVGTGGVWVTTDRGDNWTSLNENLPNTTTSAIAWTPHGGGDGTIVAVTGDHTFGSYAFVGTGAYYTRDLGATWNRSNGIPDGALAFAAETHPLRPNEIYVGTSVGLFRSTDGGANFSVVALPVGPTTDDGQPCDGVTDIMARPDCTFANHVTDVVIQAPGGASALVNGEEPVVVAAVGWRGGEHVAEGTDVTQAPNNGIYRSTDGGNSFTYVTPPPADTAAGFTEKERIGRIELGPTIGEEQNHNYLYAAVQDAVALNNGVGAIDVPEGEVAPVPGTALEGLYVSSDFGSSWVRLVDGQHLASDPDSGSSLRIVVPALTAFGFQPGVQAWYNLCIHPDPTRQLGGIPTRVILCLEEVWQNEDADAGVPNPQEGAGDTEWKVIGRYFSGDTCLFLTVGAPCIADRTTPNTYTTHPDQHAVTFLPFGEGGVSLIVGNDGGVYRQDVEAGQAFDNANWGAGRNDGFNTLLPYHAQTSKDNTVWFGLQDNGSAKIDPDPKPVPEDADEVERFSDRFNGERFLKYETFGGDGFFVATDPDNSDIAYSETPFAAMRVTSDGGLTWSGLAPGVDASKFSNPFVMDPSRSTHLMTAGRQVAETVFGPGTTSPPSGDDPTTLPQPSDWRYVFDLGTVNHPGDPDAEASDTDPANSMSAVDLERDNAYVGFCGTCDILNTDIPFKNGIATNVAAEDVPGRMTSQGWHFARAEGLPNRYITSIEIDPEDAKTVYVTLGGYTREWTPPGSLGDTNDDIGTGHLFVSHDAGETFTDITSNLPDVTATWVTLRGDDQLLVGTDVGAFISDADGVQPGEDAFVPMPGLPAVPISSIEVTPQDRDLVTVAAYGRGIWQYRFDESIDAPFSSRIETGRDLYVGGRIGMKVAPTTLVYAKAGYTNTSIEGAFQGQDTGDQFEFDSNVDGYRLGAGVE
ncbi:MAG: glycoside hydrolase, partial [Actinobacteria bacterium]|nr:glycoside hydrolase [Actinomycetota bacterium]